MDLRWSVGTMQSVYQINHVHALTPKRHYLAYTHGNLSMGHYVPQYQSSLPGSREGTAL